MGLACVTQWSRVDYTWVTHAPQLFRQGARITSDRVRVRVTGITLRMVHPSHIVYQLYACPIHVPWLTPSPLGSMVNQTAASQPASQSTHKPTHQKDNHTCPQRKKTPLFGVPHEQLDEVSDCQPPRTGHALVESIPAAGWFGKEGPEKHGVDGADQCCPSPLAGRPADGCVWPPGVVAAAGGPAGAVHRAVCRTAWRGRE
eukprot:363627-Chlamydomonas_euryale.AAC.5